MNLGGDLDGLQAQLRIVAAPVEDQNLTGVDEVRVLHLLLVHAPELRPAVRFLEELAGNAPQGVARHDNVPVGRRIGEL